MSVSVSLCMYLYTAQRWPQETHALCGNQLSTWTAAASSNTATLVTMAVLVKYLHHYWIYIDVDWMKSIRLHVAVLLWQLCISRHSGTTVQCLELGDCHRSKQMTHSPRLHQDPVLRRQPTVVNFNLSSCFTMKSRSRSCEDHQGSVGHSVLYPRQSMHWN